MKKLFLGLNLFFLKFIRRINYKYYRKHFPLYLRKTGVKFTGDISKTGFIADSVKFDSLAYAHLIEIGERTTISSNVLILVHDYSIGTAIRHFNNSNNDKMQRFLKNVKIGNNCFIGARAIILPGTTIGDNTIVGAGAVLKGNYPEGVVIAGNPAKIIKTTKEYAKIHLEKNDYLGKL